MEIAAEGLGLVCWGNIMGTQAGPRWQSYAQMAHFPVN